MTVQGKLDSDGTNEKTKDLIHGKVITRIDTFPQSLWEDYNLQSKKSMKKGLALLVQKQSFITADKLEEHVQLMGSSSGSENLKVLLPILVLGWERKCNSDLQQSAAHCDR